MSKESSSYIKKIIIFTLIYTAIIIPLSSMAMAENLETTTPPAPVEEVQLQEPPVPEPPKEVTLAMVGDILMDSWVGVEIKNQGVDYPWVGVKDVLSSADLAIGNLESSVGVSGTPIKGKSFTFRARPETLQGVANAGIDIVTLANNHVLDYGTTALGETLDNLDQYGIARAGAGRNVYEAFAPAVREVNGLKVGVLSFSRVVPYGWWIPGHTQPGVANGWDTQQVLDTIKNVDAQVDLLVVSIHWGKELADYPAQDQTNLARTMIDTGADIILGHHSHCLQGIEVYKEKPIFYSVGNFVFTSSSIKARTGAIALVTAAKDGVKEVQIIPTRLNRGQPQILTGNVKAGEINRVELLSKPFGVTLDEEGLVESYKLNQEIEN